MDWGTEAVERKGPYERVEMELPVSPAAKLGKGGVGGAVYSKATLQP